MASKLNDQLKVEKLRDDVNNNGKEGDNTKTESLNGDLRDSDATINKLSSKIEDELLRLEWEMKSTEEDYSDFLDFSSFSLPSLNTEAEGNQANLSTSGLKKNSNSVFSFSDKSDDEKSTEHFADIENNTSISTNSIMTNLNPNINPPQTFSDRNSAPDMDGNLSCVNLIADDLSHSVLYSAMQDLFGPQGWAPDNFRLSHRPISGDWDSRSNISYPRSEIIFSKSFKQGEVIFSDLPKLTFQGKPPVNIEMRMPVEKKENNIYPSTDRVYSKARYQMHDLFFQLQKLKDQI